MAPIWPASAAALLIGFHILKLLLYLFLLLIRLGIAPGLAKFGQEQKAQKVTLLEEPA